MSAYFHSYLCGRKAAEWLIDMAEEKKVSKDRGKWFREMRSELKKVVWPDGKTTAKNTGTVLLCSLIVGAAIWIFDAVAVLAVDTLIGLF